MPLLRATITPIYTQKTLIFQTRQHVTLQNFEYMMFLPFCCRKIVRFCFCAQAITRTTQQKFERNIQMPKRALLAKITHTISRRRRDRLQDRRQKSSEWELIAQMPNFLQSKKDYAFKSCILVHMMMNLTQLR